MLWMLLYFLGVTLTLLEIYSRWKYRSLREIPGLPWIPILGSTLYFTADVKNFVPILEMHINKYGHISKLCLFGQMGLIISDLNMVEYFLSSPRFNTKSVNYDFFEPWLGKGLFLSGPKERQLRKLHTSGFHFNIMQDHIAVFNEQCHILINMLRKNVDTEFSVNIFPILSRYTLDVIIETACGINLNIQNNPQAEFFDAVHFMISMPLKRTLSSWKRFDLLYHLSSDYCKQKRYLQIIDDFSIRAIENRRKLLHKNNTDSDFESSNKYHKRRVILDNILSGSIDGKPVPDSLIHTEINSIIFAGHDTSAPALTFVIHALAKYKHVQNKVLSELKEIFRDDWDRPVVLKDLSEMRYMEITIKETLRLYGLAPVIMRKLNEDVNYKLGQLSYFVGPPFTYRKWPYRSTTYMMILDETKIPKGTTLAFNLYGIHHSTDYFESPHDFNPERFLTESTKRPYSFVAFSAGPKNCLGQKYAMNEIKVTLTQLLRNFEFLLPDEPDKQLELCGEMIIKPKDGAFIKLRSRRISSC